MKTLNARLGSNRYRLAMLALGIVCLLGAGLRANVPMAVNPPAPPVQAQPAVNQDIRDIRPPYHIPPGWLWMAWTAGAIAILALGYAAWRWRRHLGIRAKLPYEIALERLEKARALMQPERAREFSIAVSEVVRDYIEKCFDVQAAHRTTTEFFRDLATRADSPLLTHQPVLTDFLNHCDLAKFARWILSVPQMQAMFNSAGAFIVTTGKPAAKGATAPPQVSPVSPATTTLNPQLT